MMNKEDGHSTGRNAGMRTAVWTGAGGAGMQGKGGGREGRTRLRDRRACFKRKC